jgi:O-antigen/teichoic acid export membrane protein
MTSKLTKGKDVNEVSYVIRICNTACLCVIVGLVLLGQPFINIVFGKEYSGAYHITLILLIGVFFMIYYKMIASYNITIGKQKINTLFLGLSVVANVLANLVLIPVCGIYGAAISSVISYALCSILFIVYFCKNCEVRLTDILFINKQDLGKLKAKFSRKETT